MRTGEDSPVSEPPGPFADYLRDTDDPPDDVPEDVARRLVEANVSLLRDAGGWERTPSIICPACAGVAVVRCSPPPTDTFEAVCECGATLVPITALVVPYSPEDYVVPDGIDLGDYDLSAYEVGDVGGAGFAEGWTIHRIVTHPSRLLAYYDELRPFTSTHRKGGPDGPRGDPITDRTPVEIQLGGSDRLALGRDGEAEDEDADERTPTLRDSFGGVAEDTEDA